MIRTTAKTEPETQIVAMKTLSNYTDNGSDSLAALMKWDIISEA